MQISAERLPFRARGAAACFGAATAMFHVLTTATLALLTVIHVHGLTDPAEHHTAADTFVEGQVRLGVIVATSVVLLTVLICERCVRVNQIALGSQHALASVDARAPPLILS